MRVKLEWLNELVNINDVPTKQLVDTLSLYSTEIESVERVLSGTNLCVGHVLTCENHPDSDHLHITTVDVGTEVLQIVCGAPNIKAGMDVIVAKIGAVLPGDFKIKKSKIRGVESFGMICSLEELGMEKKYVPQEYQDGIYYFTKEVAPGDNPLKLLNFEDDILELGLTPNRSDMLSMLGVAYEVAAVYNRKVNVPSCEYTQTKKAGKEVCVQVETEKCPLYYAKRIENIKIGKSPEWLSSRLIAFGIRPINNAVDITNYILALFGQPLHAFDADKLGDKILVRQALDGEEFVTLDNIKRTLCADDIVITDGEKPVCLAGVMGGINSGISGDTKNVILEAAIFDPIAIRKTYKKQDLRSEAAIRYEKGLDANRTILALNYACYLFKTLCEADIIDGVNVVNNINCEDKVIKVTEEYISSYLGVQITKEEIISICNRLGFTVNDDLEIKVPSRRKDIAIKADIAEEVGRLHGYEHLPSTLPQTSSCGELTKFQKDRRTIRTCATNLGLVEAVNYSLCENNNEFKYLTKENSVDIELLLPISQERKVLRRNLVNSLLENVGYVFNRKINSCAYFELGKVYYKENDSYVEEEHIAFAMSGVLSQILWQGKQEKVDFFTLKGIVNNVFEKVDITLDYQKMENVQNELHPLRSAFILYNNEKVGYIGMLHPKYAMDKDLKDVYVCEVNLSKLIGKDKEVKIYTPVSKVPSVERDLAFVLPKSVSSGQLVSEIKKTDSKTISSVAIFDVYEGEKVAPDQKSIAFKVVFTSNETLTDDVINSKVNKIIKNVEKNLNGGLRA